MNTDDHIDNSRWQSFCNEFVADFNPPVLKQMIRDIKEIEEGMKKYIRPILNRRNK